MQYSGIPSQSDVAFPATNLRSGTCGSSRDYFSLVWTSQLGWVQLCAGVSLDSSVKRPAPKVGNLSVRGPSASLEAYCVWEPGELATPTTTAEAHSMIPDLGKIAQKYLLHFLTLCTLWCLPSITFHLATRSSWASILHKDKHALLYWY